MQNDQDEHEYIIKMLKEQISKVQSKVINVDQRISKMQGACAERHRFSLDAQLQKLQARETFEQEKEKKLEERLDAIEKLANDHKLEAEKRFNSIQEAMKDRCKSVQEDNNQFRTRIATLEQERSARQEQRITIKTQVIIGVIVSLLTSLIMSIASQFAHFHITYDDGNKQQQTVQTIEINEQGNNK